MANVTTSRLTVDDGTITWDDMTIDGILTATGFTIGSAVIDETDLEKLDGITNGVGAANKAVVLDGNADFEFQDGDKLAFGNSGDLKIYHENDNSFINDQGTGQIVVIASAFNVNNAANDASMLTMLQGGATKIYYNGSAKLETTNTGGTLTGTLTTTAGINVSGNAYFNNNDIYDVGAAGMQIISGQIRVGGGTGRFVAPYQDANENYQGTFGWNHLKLGNNAINYIIAGKTATGGDFQFVVNNTNAITTNGSGHNGIVAMTIDNAGKVGIGTIAPFAKIQVVDNNMNTILASDDAGMSRYCAIGADGNGAWVTGGSGQSSHVNLTFRTTASGSEGTAMVLDANKHATFYNNIYMSGNGDLYDVGNANSQWTGDGIVVEGSTNAFIDIRKGNAGTGNLRFLNGSTEEFRIFLNTAETWMGFSHDGGSNNDLEISTSTGYATFNGTGTNFVNGVNCSSTMRFSNSSKDTSSVATAIASYSLTFYPPDATNYYGNDIGWSEGSTVAAFISAVDEGSGGALGLTFGTGTNSAVAERMRIDESGLVTGTHGTYHSGSDRRLKKDIVTIPDALTKVMALRGVNFRWKDESKWGTSLKMGMIAQEVETVVPEVVHTQDKPSTYEEGLKAVEYPFVVGLLVEAIKELKAEIDELKSG